jgi:xylulokinase
LGSAWCLEHLLNSPGNFTAAKLAWVKNHEPHLFEKAAHCCLPGDYLALRMSGTLHTTASGLSEGTLWDFPQHEIAFPLLDHFGISRDLIPPLVPNVGEQGALSVSAATVLQLPAGIPIAYRAGDQPNNALSLGVIAPGQVAATGGTSGVVYAVSNQLVADAAQRVNTFAHVNHQQDTIRTGILLCINGAGIQYGWLRRMIGQGMDYPDLEALAQTVPAGAEGLSLLPFGNGAERMLQNKNPGTLLSGLDLNRHHQAHLIRATLEGIAFAFVYGMKQLQAQGISLSQMRAGNDNLFQSAIFSNTIAALSECHIQLVKTTGAIGAAQAAGAGAGIYNSLEEAIALQMVAADYTPAPVPESLSAAYARWEAQLHMALSLS